MLLTTNVIARMSKSSIIKWSVLAAKMIMASLAFVINASSVTIITYAKGVKASMTMIILWLRLKLHLGRLRKKILSRNIGRKFMGLSSLRIMWFLRDIMSHLLTKSRL